MKPNVRQSANPLNLGRRTQMMVRGEQAPALPPCPN